MANTDIYKFVFPVSSGEDSFADGQFSTVISNIAGTAFSIGQGMFLTAAHVIQQTGAGTRRISCLEEDSRNLVGTLPSDIEIIESLDLAIIYAPDFPYQTAISWTQQPQSRLAQVFSSGYPFALDNETLTVSGRAFMGSVVGVTNFHKLEANPEIYELSFNCPRGLSGAPVVCWGKQPLVCGLVIGNLSMEMNILTEKEKVTDESTTIFERYEALHLGIALTSNTILEIESKLLKGTIREHLIKQNLLV